MVKDVGIGLNTYLPVLLKCLTIEEGENVDARKIESIYVGSFMTLFAFLNLLKYSAVT